MPELRKEMRVIGRRSLDGALARVQAVEPGVEVKVHLAFGATHDVLLDSLTGAQLLVVGSRGRGTLASLVLGSVSAGVAATAPCPVAVIRDAEARRDSPTFSGRVAVGVDGSEVSMAALDLAFALASERGIGVGVVHSWGPAAVRRDLTSHEQRQATVEEHELQVAESLAGLAEKYPDVDVTTHQAEEDPRRALDERRGTPTCSSSAPAVGARPSRRCSARSAGTSSSTRTARSWWSALPPDRKNPHLGTQEPAPRQARTHGSARKNARLGGGGGGRTRVPAC